MVGFYIFGFWNLGVWNWILIGSFLKGRGDDKNFIIFYIDLS